MARVKLLQLAHGRSGDKNDTCNIGLVARNPEAYEILKREITAERVREYFRGLVEGEVTRYELPNLMALNFVLKKALGGGGTKTLRFDTIGRSMASALLEMEIEVDQASW